LFFASEKTNNLCSAITKKTNLFEFVILGGFFVMTLHGFYTLCVLGVFSVLSVVKRNMGKGGQRHGMFRLFYKKKKKSIDKY
jgi:hypothetical protein